MTTRTTLRRDLADLKQKIYDLGEKCIETANLYNSLQEQYTDALEARINDLGTEIKNSCEELHDQCFLVLTLQQPLIKDLRFVIGSLQIVLNIEKISSLFITNSTSVAHISIVNSEVKNNFIKLTTRIEELIKVSLMSYLSGNIASYTQAKNIHNEIALQHDVIYKSLLSALSTQPGNQLHSEALLISSIRTLEKISDLSFDISSQSKYIVDGRDRT